MNGTYCAHCNRFLFTNKQEHYCRVCKTLLSKLPMDYAEFTALAQVMVYVGGVVIFVVFTILLPSRLGEDAFAVKIPRVFAAFALSIIFVLVMVKCLLPIEGLSSGTALAPVLGYGEDGFVIPFEVVSILLLMTLICAITIARKGKEEEEK